MTLRLLIDTCVWFDLAKDHKQRTNLHVLEGLITEGLVSLIVPQTVLDEFSRNKKRVLEETGKSVASTLKRARDIIIDLGDKRRAQSAMRLLNEVDYRVAGPADESKFWIGRIQTLLAKATPIAVSEELKVRAAERAIAGRAPFHRQKNSMGDAILIETYAAVVKNGKPKERFGFVTHNTKDFSAVRTAHKNPHPDIADCFSRIKSRYFITLGDALKAVSSKDMGDIFIEEEFTEQPRSLTEVLEAIDELVTKVWYNRHKNREWEIAHGKVKIIDTYDPKRHNTTITRHIWEGALKAAANVEKRFAGEELRWDDFDWGMLNGKLSALRWVIGDEWDMLDT